jgi:CheY-like chemotaxis protein
MDQETLAQATEPFFTTKDPGKGTGLGLSMVQGVVDQSGGVTRLRSAPGKGTEVEIWLPRSHTLPTTNVASPRPTRPVSTGKTILVCDDNPAVLEYLDDVLKDEGYNVIALDNGELALSALQTDPTINLLILDFTMPGLNGAALAHDVQATHPKLPILLITGDVQIESIQLKLGDVPMLRKPFSPDQLTVCVSNLLHH